MSRSQGFWSYVHKDDLADTGRIVLLAKDVAEQFEMQTGEAIDLFLDKENIEWGDDWKSSIDQGLASVAFFIPVLTPRYFMSAECRRELQFFARKAEKLGVKDLVLPLLYVDVSALHEENPSDDLVALINRFQWEDWTDLRFAEPSSGAYRKAVVKLAERLASANRVAEHLATTDTNSNDTVHRDSSDQEAPGLVDMIADAEEAMPDWQATVEEIGNEITRVGNLVQQKTRDLNHVSTIDSGMRGRVRVAKALSVALTDPSRKVEELGSKFATQLHTVDDGIRALISLASESDQPNAEERTSICDFFASIKSLSSSIQGSVASMQSMVDSFEPLERMSRDLRLPLRRLRTGLTATLEAREVASEWSQLIQDSGVACEDKDG